MSSLGVRGTRERRPLGRFRVSFSHSLSFRIRGADLSPVTCRLPAREKLYKERLPCGDISSGSAPRIRPLCEAAGTGLSRVEPGTETVRTRPSRPQRGNTSRNTSELEPARWQTKRLYRPERRTAGGLPLVTPCGLTVVSADAIFLFYFFLCFL